MATVEIFFSKNFFLVTSVKKSSKYQKFYIILGPTVNMRVPNMYIKFRKDRSSSFGEKINTAWKKLVLRKTRLKFFSIKIVKKLYLQLISDAGTIQNPFCFDLLKSIFLIVFFKLIKWDNPLSSFLFKFDRLRLRYRKNLTNIFLFLNLDLSNLSKKYTIGKSLM